MKAEIPRGKEMRNPKAEIRKKSEARNPNPKASRQVSGCNAVAERKKTQVCGGLPAWIFGFRISAFFRASAFGFRISRRDFGFQP